MMAIDDAQRLLAVMAGMLRELRGADAPPPSLDDDLERTLGIDSLARMELMLRLERDFDRRMPEALVQDAQTPRDLLRALAAAVPRPGAKPEAEAEAIGPASEAARAQPQHARTLIEVLQWHALQHPQHMHITLIDADEGALQPLTQLGLLERAQAVAAGLQGAGIEAGQSVALMLPTGLAFFEAFAGILLAGGVPVPIYPPFRASQIEDHLRRQAHILDNARAVLLIADERARQATRVLRAGVASLRGVVTVEQIAVRGGAPAAVARNELDTAFLQYTSGSTGAPKGVVLSHANLLANIRAMGQAVRTSAQDVFVSWLPLYHDMGLIGAWLGSLYYGMSLMLMPPQAFLARPARWLRAIHRYRGTLSAAPNFAYEILATRVPEDELQGLDLSSWRVAFNGAEPVHAQTLARFAERFARHGFDARAMLPVYGLAESGLGLAFPPLGRGPRIDRVDRRALRESAQARPADAGDEAAMQVVCCGAPLAGHQIRVVDARGAEQPERGEGRIEFRGPSATAGYFRNADATRALFDGEWLDTGDVGYIAEGELYLTSRVKDLIIRGGHNIHPYDLEEAVGHLPGVRKGCVAVFGAGDPHSATDRVVVLAETRERDALKRAALRGRVAELSIALLGVPADDIVLAEERVVLKTSSGKIRRAACRELYERGALGGPHRSVARQMARLWMDALASRARALARLAAGAAYAMYLWALFGLTALLGSTLIALLPALHSRKRAARSLARGVLRASALPLQVEGTGHLQAQRPAVVVCNHASYVDWLLLTALLPAEACFVAKAELRRMAPLRWLLQRVGTRFVSRDDVHESVEDARRLLDDARGGATLVFFPEGTIDRAPGLRPFHLGAFMISAQSGLPLVPVVVRGTRSVLRDGSWWPRRQPVRVSAHAPLLPEGSAWAHALKLRDAARRVVAAGCGEPDLAMPMP
jgi:1-acyl-sn-glycerol-3-phosphate acyltransferase